MTDEPFSWEEYIAPDEQEIAERLRALRVHPAAREDAQEGRQPPKIEALGGHLLFSIWDLDPKSVSGRPDEIVVLIGAHRILTIQRSEDGRVRSLRPIIRGATANEELPTDTPLRAAYRILEAVVHDYVHAVRAIEDELDGVEAEVFDDSVLEDHERIYRLRRRIGRVDRAVSALAKAIDTAPREALDLLDEDDALQPYLQHMHNDLDALADLLASQRLALDAVVSSHESNVSSRQNQDMRTIAAVAALLAIPTVVGGIYGMNFKDMPLLHTPGGWAVILGITAVLDVIAVFEFRRRGWLGEAPRRDR
ncbi:CorA family divalent cation transporter [Microbacterium sp. YJN-G]|uniref:CorA family divalent cation transporter n=1 Tax=Microbacterium sp. YJN-G TaxID=2763257 RepID=UPI0018779C13|nr:CorA family divalent cation transporter [Microbacterium sp. YJN-G]